MTRFRLATLILVALSLGGCVMVPVAPRPAYVAPAVAVVAPVPFVGVRVYR